MKVRHIWENPFLSTGEFMAKFDSRRLGISRSTASAFAC